MIIRYIGEERFLIEEVGIEEIAESDGYSECCDPDGPWEDNWDSDWKDKLDRNVDLDEEDQCEAVESTGTRGCMVLCDRGRSYHWRTGEESNWPCDVRWDNAIWERSWLRRVWV